MVREVADRDLLRLAKGIMALLDDPPADQLQEAVAAVQSLDDLGPALNRACIAMQARLALRLKTKQAGYY